MARTKGSRNKKLVEKVLEPLSNFKSLEVARTQIIKVPFSKHDIDEHLIKKAKGLAAFDKEQLFEKEEIVYDKKGNAFVTLVNPTNLPKVMKDIQNPPKKSTGEVVNEFGGK